MNKHVNWNIPVPKVLDDALEEAVMTKSIYSNKSDFVRDSVRRRLEELGYKPKTFNQSSMKVCEE
jgi:Arc/MetJ-type ribon-helix-helix transcriptional regulator